MLESEAKREDLVQGRYMGEITEAREGMSFV